MERWERDPATRSKVVWLFALAEVVVLDVLNKLARIFPAATAATQLQYHEFEEMIEVEDCNGQLRQLYLGIQEMEQQIFRYICIYASMYIYIYIYIYIFISIHYYDDPRSGTQIALSDRLLFSNPLAALFGHSSTQVMKKKSEEKHERHAKLTHSFN